MSQEKKAELAGRISKKLGSAESRLFAARRDLHDLETMVMEIRKLDIEIFDGNLCMDYVCQLGALQGDIARVEGQLYPIHADLTVIAIKEKVDVEGPYLVLARYMPDVDSRSGGGRR